MIFIFTVHDKYIMRRDSEKKFLGLGFDTDLIQKIDSKGLTLSSLKPMSKQALLQAGFTNEEKDLIYSKTKRDAIAAEVLDAILLKSGEVCCYCSDGISTRPFHIHHMDEYHVSRNNDEDNLVLVCPNDHSNVHTKNITIEEQKAVKMAWENLWNIAQEYKAKGISFPFGAFETIDYSVKGNITDIFSFSSPIGSVCLVLAKGDLSERCLKTIEKENSLILAGGSGSGKTTLAKGIAGQIEDAVVFKYVVSDKSSIEIAKEITQFLSLAQKKLVLIIDDANTKLKVAQIESILQFANKNQKIIVVNTRESFFSEGNLEQHFPNSVEHISWPVICDEVIKSILKSETEIISYLDKNEVNDHSGERIGYSVFDHRLNRIAEKYAKSTDSVWQFIYMLGGGLTKVNKEYRELQSKDRFDLIVLYISIKQIAKVEEGSDIDEIIALYHRNSILKKNAAPAKEWLREKLDELCKKRILVESRGRYKTVHREFSNAFIETAYLMNRNDASELLDEVFKDLVNAKEIMILWSWLKSGKANDYAKRWSSSLTIVQWKSLTAETIKHGLPILAVLARHLHTVALPGHHKIANEVFKDRADQIADLIDTGDKNMLYYFREIGTTLKYHCPEIIKPIMDKIDSDKFAGHIKDSDIEAFDNLSWLFDTLAGGHLEWVINFQSKFSFADFQRIIERNEKGKISTIYEVISFYRRYIGNIKKSEFDYFIDIISLQIKRCSLQEVQFPELFIRGLPELIFYETKINKILGFIDIIRFQKDFEQATPRYWGSVLSLSILCNYTENSFSRDFVDGLDLNKIVSNTEKHYETNLHEFRILLFQLGYGSDAVKKEYAIALQPMVENVMMKFTEEQDHENILEAFCNLDRELGEESCTRLNKVIPEQRSKIDKIKYSVKSKILAAEESGKDYLMEKWLISLKDEVEEGD
ncbi:HNH endonuclease [Flavobacterium collinsii]|uniref:nSTAND3 domain-containing NTPase n=1 Tax=Flavobacterium collinsii TaxID=1114861 RepID=UPI00375657B3